MLDPIYNLPLEKQLALAEKQKAKLIYYTTMPKEERKKLAEELMAIIDRLPLEWRLAIHEYGYARVRKALRECKTVAQFHREQMLRTLDFQL